MNKILACSALALGFLCFTACEDDNDSNPTLKQPTEFVLNTPSYVNYTVDLAQSESVTLTWSQPDYTDLGAPLAVTYQVQLSLTDSWTVSYEEANDEEATEDLVADYTVIDKTVTTCTYDVAASEIATAIQQLAAYSEDAVPETQKVYVRVYAYIAEGSSVLYPIASNSVLLTFAPYYVELSDADPILFYIVGNDIGDGAWSQAYGTSAFPLFIQSDYSYDKKTGGGEITYLNYFEEWCSFKFQPSDWNWDYGFMYDGDDAAVYRNGGSDAGNICVSASGYYLITINTTALTCTIEKQDITPTNYQELYGGICLSGSFNDWGDTEMTAVHTTTENHVWAYIMTVAAGETEQFKFKPAGTWDVNWGYGDNDGDINTCGVGTLNGHNLGLGEGTWLIMFNDITGEFAIYAN